MRNFLTCFSALIYRIEASVSRSFAKTISPLAIIGWHGMGPNAIPVVGDVSGAESRSPPGFAASARGESCFRFGSKDRTNWRL